MTRKCSVCKLNKDVSMFYRKRANKSGYQAACKLCDNIRRNKYARKKYKNRDSNFKKHRRDRVEMKDYYIKTLLLIKDKTGLKEEDITAEMIETKRESLKFKRKFKLTGKLKGENDAKK